MCVSSDKRVMYVLTILVPHKKFTSSRVPCNVIEVDWGNSKDSYFFVEVPKIFSSGLVLTLLWWWWWVNGSKDTTDL